MNYDELYFQNGRLVEIKTMVDRELDYKLDYIRKSDSIITEHMYNGKTLHKEDVALENVTILYQKLFECNTPDATFDYLDKVRFLGLFTFNFKN